MFSLSGSSFREELVMGARRIRREQRQVDMAESRSRNGIRKAAERTRRHARLKAALEKSKPPYSPTVLSWLSAELDKPGRLITPEDVQKFLKAPPKPRHAPKGRPV
jgi:hypothetical protein